MGCKSTIRIYNYTLGQRMIALGLFINQYRMTGLIFKLQRNYHSVNAVAGGCMLHVY